MQRCAGSIKMRFVEIKPNDINETEFRYVANPGATQLAINAKDSLTIAPLHLTETVLASAGAAD